MFCLLVCGHIDVILSDKKIVSTTLRLIIFVRSHYFKQDKPFMTMLSQVAVSLAFELSIQKDVNGSSTRRGPSGGPNQLRAEPPKPAIRTMEERRTILAVFHLTSA